MVFILFPQVSKKWLNLVPSYYTSALDILQTQPSGNLESSVQTLELVQVVLKESVPLSLSRNVIVERYPPPSRWNWSILMSVAPCQLSPWADQNAQ